MRSALPVLAVFLLACPPALRRPESPQLLLTGSVSAGGFSRRGSPVEGAVLVLRDAATGEELVRNVSSPAGGYRLATPLPMPRRLVLVATAPGYAPHARAFSAASWSELTFSFALTPLAELECVDELCQAPEVDLEWVGPPEGASGRAQTFDLGVEPPVLVDVDDTAPTLLAMAHVELSHADAGTLFLRVPVSRWAWLVDATPGNGVIDVPTARFDLERASWSRGPPAPLFTEGGLPVPESALPALRRGDFSGGAVAALANPGSGGLAVLGDPAPRGCVDASISVEGQPSPGVTMFLGDAEPVVAKETGEFCAVVPLGEAPLPGAAQYAGQPYTLGNLTRPTSPGSCSAGGCVRAGTLGLFADKAVTAAMCRFSGRIVDTRGEPVPGAEVVAFDHAITANTFTTWCGALGTRCSVARPSGDDGAFTLNAPLLASFVVAARATFSGQAGDGPRRGALRVTGCPTTPLTVRLDQGVERLDVSASFTGTTISWSPPRAAARLAVHAADGTPKWELEAVSGLVPPLTWGLAPSGTIERLAPVSPPASGDTLVVELDGVDPDGIVYSGVGGATRP
jgi:hypothetical protein